MHDLPLLRDLVILVGIAIPVVIAAHRLRIPSIVGFLVTGIAIGPNALGLVRETEAVAGLAEIGVVLLLFAIGLELSLARVMRMRETMLRGGLLQVGSTVILAALIAVAFGAPLPRAILYGALVALSSTAVVLKVYADRGALDTPHGRIVVAVLLFQDLCIVPLVVLVRILGGAGSGPWSAIRDIGLSLAVVAALVVGGRAAVPWMLQRVVGVKNRELFTVVVVFFCLGAAYLTASFGLSLALGAFLAGLVVSESEFGLQALSDVLPFRDAFSGIFFTSVGMLLDVRFVLGHPVTVLALAGGVITLKVAAGAFATGMLRRSLQVSIVAGLGLAQIGEFSFVLATVAATYGLIGGDTYQAFLSASVASLLLAPLLIATARPVADGVCRLIGKPTGDLAAAGGADAAQLTDHVIIVGYGVSGRHLARVLDGAGIPYVILEQNGQVVQRARRDLQPILFGDATRPEVLHRVHLERARVIVFAISSAADELRGVAVARAHSRRVRIVVRTQFVAAAGELERAGADEVIAQEFETSLEIFARVLHHYDIPSNTIEREIHAARTEHYGVVRGRAEPSFQLDALAHLGVHRALDILEVEPGARAVGGHPATLQLRRETGATVVAIIRQGQAYYAPEPAFRFAPGDTVVLVGDADALALARTAFVAPAPGP
ncbi:MAG TPA: cation:proton antiporter [Gemmatimonadales bacterium]